jgi:DNA-binding NtrC family response regulator
MGQDGETRTIHQEVQAESLTLQKYRLVDAHGRSEDFDRRLIYVGSAPDNHFVVDDPTVSRVHFKIEVDSSGHRIRDLDSKNGTLVGDVSVIDAYLPNDCVIRIGEAELQFKLGEETVEVALASRNAFGSLLGESLQMRETFALLGRVAPTHVTVLVEGDSGTGKELVAEALHQESPRQGGPFVVFDCSAVPRELIESELFGHIKGAFTGATTNRIGAFEEANGGTLFLDEIGELPLDLQPKLLRVLEKREVKPVGGNEKRAVNCRIVAATNRNLEAEVRQGNFREDLYYRLAVIRIQLPPLRSRVDDIPLLVNHFVNTAGTLIPDSPSDFQISYETMSKLKQYEWPGNVRELKNFVERAVLLADSNPIDTKFIGGRGPHVLAAEPAVTGDGNDTVGHGSETGAIRVDYRLPFKDAKSRLVDEFETAYWQRMLELTKGNVSEAARQGGIHRKSLEYLLKKIDLSEPAE